MKFLLDMQRWEFDMAAYLTAMRKSLTEVNKEAGRIWIHAAVEVIPIPTWSGASRATFQKLAREVGTSVPIGPRRARDRTALGRLSSTTSGVIEDKAAHYYGFQYVSDLRYLTYNEFNHAVPGPPPQPRSRAIDNTPYNFQAKGTAAWKQFAKDVRLPSPLGPKFLKKIKIA